MAHDLYKIPLGWLLAFGLACGALGYVIACRDAARGGPITSQTVDGQPVGISPDPTTAITAEEAPSESGPVRTY